MNMTSNDLLHCNNLVPLSDVSLELYREFSESVLMKRLFIIILVIIKRLLFPSMKKGSEIC